jgi:medium-chain acyl-[acyl-carrier-protein] hydrolase
MALGGLEDHEASRARLDDWRHETGNSFDLRMFAGGHFFIHTARPELLQHVAHRLERSARSFA